MTKMKFSGKIILIVGASSGMGRVLALRLAEERAKIIAIARRQPLLDSLAQEISANGGECFPIAADAMDESAANDVVEAVVGRYGRLDVIYLNAGGAPALDIMRLMTGGVCSYLRSNYDVVVNFLVPTLKQMVKQGGGHAGHPNSLAGFLGVPLHGPS
ncbi:SDR family NAD(P)-dependent oxidoreductase [Agrobacterium rubi]|uniref:SDR family NAD(P)-dependent oxidoreductase n=1 Tax=Agrobacterium rubi TaxID=28099 RepID=UPI001F3133FA|nr:SDR family NAD(P)-dependent oxidoreductase [Agrobacterium rubi]